MFHSARGFAMPVVVALVAVFATILGTALVTVASSQHVGLGLDMQGARAHYAARAGLDWAMYHVLRNGLGCASIDTKSVVFGGNLSGFRATLACSETLHDEGGTQVRMYTITATSCNANSCTPAPPPPGYVNRQLTVTVSK
jgi:MSHA biogenesis protein MshP